MKYLTFNQKSIEQLDKAYIKAVVEERESFVYRDSKLLTKYAKYLLDYLKSTNYKENMSKDN